MLPVKVMCGQRWGLHITATTAMPEAVLTGLALSFGSKAFLCAMGTAAMMSTSRGCEDSPYLLATWPFNLVRGGVNGRGKKRGVREGENNGGKGGSERGKEKGNN